MTPTRAAALALVTAGLLSAGCGKSEEEKFFEDVERKCNAATADGLTPTQIFEDYGRSASWDIFRLDCSSTISSIAEPGPLNQCTPVDQDPQCPLFFVWVLSDADLTEPGRSCAACEVRQNASDLAGEGVDPEEVPVCGSRFRIPVCCPGAEC